MEPQLVSTDSITLPTGATSGARIVLDGTTDTILIYDSTGALVMSLAASAGTDGLGNAYPEGTAVFDATRHEIVNILNGVLYQGYAANAGSQIDYVHAGFLATASPTTAEYASPYTAGNNNVQALYTANPGGSLHPFGATAAPTLQFQSPANTGLLGVILGAWIGPDTNGTNGLAQWMTPSLNAGWSNLNIRSGRPLTYRHDAEDNMVFSGSLSTTSATPSNPIFTTNSAPKDNQSFLVLHQNSGGTLVNICVGFWNTAGALEIFSSGTITSGDIFTFVATLPMGNLL